ncbi:LRR receptor-like serine threonine-protein kinase [Seminavis robusta]|uniref:LRR receptor-like serine threonine-protein kinase n=1 Tax=Seminavis robusta TaxID=568900 RepID=A0A9N8H8Q1_9STRA|nr:LRR receptor-like serine threonine-protein kinase [Seminavis robusta]|eukprot:Sro177_g077720.1 LRR receptor-like serine threonine-protein kinase (666) ;mRNA; r:33717-36065
MEELIQKKLLILNQTYVQSPPSVEKESNKSSDDEHILTHTDNSHKSQYKTTHQQQTAETSFFESLSQDVEPLPFFPLAPQSFRGGSRDVAPGAYATGGPLAHQVAPGTIPRADDGNERGGALTSEDSNLHHAEPVEELDFEQIPTAQPMIQNSKSWWKRKLFWSLSTEALVAILIVLAITIGVAVKNHGHNRKIHLKQKQGTIIKIPRIPAATNPPPSLFGGLNLSDYTLEALTDPSSPQSKAFEWLVEGNMGLPNWRLVQRFALATFFCSTRGDRWVNHHGWMDWQTHECDWEQHFLDPEDLSLHQCDTSGQVISLSIVASNLAGTLPTEISLLSPSLQLLDLSKNMGLTGQIPSEIGLLTRLTSLQTHVTSLSGRLPTELGMLENLNVAFLGADKISGSVPSELGLLTKLTSIFFSSMGLSGSLPAELFQLTNLENFGMDSCHGIDSKSVFLAVTSQMSWLRSLIMVGGERASISLSSEIGQLTKLENFMMEGWNMGNSCIPSEIGKLSRLTHLAIEQTSLAGSLPSEISLLSDLWRLVLSSNRMTGILTPELFHNLRGLKKLDMSGNPVFGSVVTEVGLLSDLKGLGLQDTWLSGTLPTELLALSKLTKLTVANSSLSGSIPDGLCHILYRYELACHSSSVCYPKKTNTSVCQGTALCGCSC